MKNIIKYFQFSFSQIQKIEKNPVQFKLSNINQNIVQLKGVPDMWNETHLRKYFDPQQKQIGEIFIQKTLTGLKKNNAILFFNNAQFAQDFINKYNNDWINTPEIQERVQCQLYKPKTKENKLKVIDDERQIEVYNLPFEATNLDILNLIPELQVEQFQMPMRTQDKNKGYCLMTFHNKDQAEIFMSKVRGMYLHGREIKVQQRYFRFASQKKRYQNKSDFIINQAETQEIQINGAIYKYGTRLFNQLCNTTVMKFLIFQANVLYILIECSRSEEIKFILIFIQNLSVKFSRFIFTVSLTNNIYPTNQSQEFKINFNSTALGNVHELSSYTQKLCQNYYTFLLMASQLSIQKFVFNKSYIYVPLKDSQLQVFKRLLIIYSLIQQNIVKFSQESEFQHNQEWDIVTGSPFEFLILLSLNKSFQLYFQFMYTSQIY